MTPPGDMATARPAARPVAADAIRDRRARKREARARGTVLRAAHIVRHLTETLVDRPLSVANTPVVVDSFRSLVRLNRAVAAQAPALDAAHRAEARRLCALLDRVLADPTPRTIDGVGRFVRDEMSLYTAVFHPPVPSAPLPPDPLRGHSFTHLVAMIGPGIGIGDEIKLAGFLRTLARGLGLAPGRVELFSFCPWIWRTLAPDAAVHGLTDAPLAAFERIDSFGPEARPLTLFGCFMRQETLRCLAATRPERDGMLVAVASGEVRLRLRGSVGDRVAQALDDGAPNFSRALLGLGRHLFPGLAPVRAPAEPLTARDHRAFHVVLNPFTSKHSTLSPADWARFLVSVRRAVPAARPVRCRIVPGLTPSCRDYAGEIRALAAHHHAGAGLTAALLDEGEAPITQETALAAVHAALADTDLLLTIDTYTAHLAAHARAVTVALCLNRNVRFWDPAPHTLWFDTTVDRGAVETAVRAVASLAARDPRDGSPFAAFAAPAAALCRLGLPGLAPGDGADVPTPDQARAWRQEADAAWAALPAAVSRALAALDADYAWPALRRAIAGPRAHDRAVAVQRAAASVFLRLALLAGAERPTRGVWP
ncbi:hypothetical protein [Azospirillum argentinense]